VLHIALHREHETAQFVIRDKGVPDHPGQKSPKPARLVSGFFIWPLHEQENKHGSI
jgi:hypothetical protein